jgi:Zn-dependent protease
VQALDLALFLLTISVYAIPVLFAITLHEVAHGWTARYLGDHTAAVLIPGSLLAFGLPLFGWAKPVPVETGVLRNPRRAMIMVALAGPAANLLMALFWCGVLAAVLQIRRGHTLDNWVVLMAQAGITVNAVLALFNMLPIPPLDGGRVLVGILPARIGAKVEKLAPAGVFIVVGLSVLGLLNWLFHPADRAINHVITVLGIGMSI